MDDDLSTLRQGQPGEFFLVRDGHDVALPVVASVLGASLVQMPSGQKVWIKNKPGGSLASRYGTGPDDLSEAEPQKNIMAPGNPFGVDLFDAAGPCPVDTFAMCLGTGISRTKADGSVERIPVESTYRVPVAIVPEEKITYRHGEVGVKDFIWEDIKRETRRSAAAMKTQLEAQMFGGSAVAIAAAYVGDMNEAAKQGKLGHDHVEDRMPGIKGVYHDIDCRWLTHSENCTCAVGSPKDVVPPSSMTNQVLLRHYHEMLAGRNAARLERDDALAELRTLRMAPTEEPGNHDWKGPTEPFTDEKGNVGRRAVKDEVAERVHRVVGDVLEGKVLPSQREQLGEALKRAPQEKKPFPVTFVEADKRRVGG